MADTRNLEARIQSKVILQRKNEDLALRQTRLLALLALRWLVD